MLKTLQTTAVAENSVEQFDVEGRDPIALYNVDGEYFATDAICTHGQASLADGDLHGYEIACPFHYGMFDVRDGKPTAPPCVVPIRTYAIEIGDDGWLYVTLSD
ncbi:MAG: non-heme iron oxygenase ferredoxin subunit [Gammaproteobacteria bacterium]|nr:non-heme iron oxygenase ferredoxin subunit [Gammaproteobacteria bacterium]NNL99304.1 non-heme iron oxygenase ferredoxin subunit [Gammaproteobacteria bacterium]